MTASVINQWPISQVNAYAPQTTLMANTTGNALVAVIGWTANTYTNTVNPISFVTDDAHNFWVHLMTSPSGTSLKAGSRCSIWLCPNANAAKVLSVACATYVLGLTAEIFEVPGLPAFAYADQTGNAYSANATNLNVVSSGSVNAGETLFCVCHIPNTNVGVTTPAGWTALNSVQGYDGAYGKGGPNDTGIYPFWMTAASTGTVTVPFATTPTTSVPISGVLVSIPAVGQTVTPVRASRPNLVVEAALNATPGLYETPWSFTDITAYAINTQGDAIINASRGRQYENTQVEAGDISINLDNHTGAFCPTNVSSPFYPLMLNTPIRVSAYWNNRQYGVCGGYVERWPQTWADPQFGITPMEATDAIGPLSNINLPSALQGEVLLDQPYVYLPCSENYTEANGLPALNLARGNQRTATYMDAIITYSPSSTRPLATGLALNLLGDMGTGIGYTALSSGTDVGPMPGAFYTDPNLATIMSGPNGMTVSWWQIIPTTRTGSGSMEMFRLQGAPSNYYLGTVTAGGFGIRMMVYLSGSSQIGVTVADYQGHNADNFWTQQMDDGLLHHYAFTVSSTATGSFQLTGYLDGVQKLSQAITGLTGGMNDIWWMSFGPQMYENGGAALGNNYAIGQVVLFPAVIPYSRLQEHHLVGATGMGGDSANTRFGKLLAWGNYGGPRGSSQSSPSPQFGPADQIQSSSIAGAMGTVATTDGGMFYCDAQNNATYWSRQFMFNRAVKWVFSDTQPVQLNANSAFNGAVAPWTAINSTAVYTAAPAQSGVGALKITPTGGNPTAGASTETITVSPSTQYQASVWGLSALGFGAFQVNVNWYTSGMALISTSSQSIALPAGVWELNSQVYTSPSNAAFATMTAVETGTPASTAVFTVDTAQFLTVPTAIPYDPSSSFGYDNTFVSNIVQSQRTINAGNLDSTGRYDPLSKLWVTSGYGATVNIYDPTSENEYFPRGPLELDIETTSDQDGYDICNWNLVQYKQPMLRVANIVLTPSANPTLWTTALSIEQGDICTVSRSPMGGAPITTTVVVQSVDHEIGADNWVTTAMATPYYPGNAVLQCDTAGFNTLGQNAIAW